MSYSSFFLRDTGDSFFDHDLCDALADIFPGIICRTVAVEKVKEYVARYGGTVTNVDEWGKKRLAYEIQKMKEGFYYFIQFEADATAPAEIERHVRIMENVIRYLCVRQEA